MSEDIESLRRDVESLKRWVAARRRWSAVKYAAYVILIVGAAYYVWQEYQAFQQLEIGCASPRECFRGVEAISPTIYRLRLELLSTNPTSVTLELEDLQAQVFINGYYVGEIYEPALKVPPGEKTHRLTIDVDVRKLPLIALQTIADNGTLEVRVEGRVTVPLKPFGLLTWRRITIPLEDVIPPQKIKVLDETRSAAASLMRSLIASERIEKLIERLCQIQLLKPRLEELCIEG